MNVKGYIETCPVAWYQWMVFFREFVNVFCKLQHTDMHSDCYRKIKTRGFEGQSKLLFWTLLIYFWFNLLAGFFRRTSKLRRKGKSIRLSCVIRRRGFSLMTVSTACFSCLCLNMPVSVKTLVLRTVFRFWPCGCGHLCRQAELLLAEMLLIYQPKPRVSAHSIKFSFRKMHVPGLPMYR